VSAPSWTYKIPAFATFTVGATEAHLDLRQNCRNHRLLGIRIRCSRCRALKYDDGVEAFIRGAHGSPAAVDLEPVRLNGNLELPGTGAGVREAGFDELDVGIRVIDPDRGRPPVPSCFTRSAGWLCSGLVAVTSKTAEAEGSVPSLDVMEVVAIALLLLVSRPVQSRC
jgi:hypothetical protein